MQELHHSTKPGRRPVALWVVTMVAAGALVLSMTMVTAEELPSGQPGGAAEHEALFAEDRFPSATTCAPCHEDIYREWSVSAHAYAQLSPVFNAMHAKITKLTNGTNGDFCIRCHTPVGMNLEEPTFMSNLDRSSVSGSWRENPRNGVQVRRACADT